MTDVLARSVVYITGENSGLRATIRGSEGLLSKFAQKFTGKTLKIGGDNSGLKGVLKESERLLADFAKKAGLHTVKIGGASATKHAASKPKFDWKEFDALAKRRSSESPAQKRARATANVAEHDRVRRRSTARLKVGEGVRIGADVSGVKRGVSEAERIIRQFMQRHGRQRVQFGANNSALNRAAGSDSGRPRGVRVATDNRGLRSGLREAARMIERFSQRYGRVGVNLRIANRAGFRNAVSSAFVDYTRGIERMRALPRIPLPPVRGRVVTNRITGDTSGLERAAAKSKSIISQLTRLAAKGVTFGFGFAGGNALFNTVANGIHRAGSAVLGLPGQFIKAGAAYDRTMVQLEASMGSIHNAEVMYARVLKMAAKTPFDTQNLANAVVMLKNYGFEGEKLIPMMNSIGNAAANSSQGMQVSVQGISRVMGQIKAAGKLNAQDVRLQLDGTYNVGAQKMLREAFGMELDGINEAIESGALTIDQVLDAILQGMNKKYGNSMDKLSKKYEGLISTLGDVWQVAMKKIGQPFYELATLKLTNLVAWTDTAGFDRIVDAASRTVGLLTEMATKAGEAALKFVGLGDGSLDGLSESIADAVAWLEVMSESPDDFKTAFAAAMEYATAASAGMFSMLTAQGIKTGVAIGTAIGKGLIEALKVSMKTMPMALGGKDGASHAVADSFVAGGNWKLNLLEKAGFTTAGKFNSYLKDFQKGVFTTFGTSEEDASAVVGNTNFREHLADTYENQQNDRIAHNSQAVADSVAKALGIKLDNKTVSGMKDAEDKFLARMAEIANKASERADKRELERVVDKIKGDGLADKPLTPEPPAPEIKQKEEAAKAKEPLAAKFMETAGLNRYFQEQLKPRKEVKLMEQNNKLAEDNIKAVNGVRDAVAANTPVAVHGD
ncbi:tape measure protein [Kordiimonas sp.]|uniref:tape measure protein n=1 Tax=Kordiimonas sp. TaxID=1970157 RepID=UPI003A93DE5B